ncbi:MAG: hypothetical protein ABL984_09795 [Pyrinomonadaceae bacterium]
MRRVIVLALLLAAVGMVSGQSLKPENPYPMSVGINKGTSDSLVGTQYWYFTALPGSNRFTVRFTSPTALYGAQMNTVVSITLYDEKRSFKITKTVTSNKTQREATFSADNVKAKMKIIVAVVPPNQNLIRMGGEYELEATGSVQFATGSSKADPIVQTYDSKMNSYGATRFLADGSIVASDGTTGTWKAFDPENRIYTIQIESFKFSLQYLPGYGLVRTSDPSLIVFQALRR